MKKNNLPQDLVYVADFEDIDVAYRFASSMIEQTNHDYAIYPKVSKRKVLYIVYLLTPYEICL